MMTVLLTVIAVVVIFSLLVLIHEYGHFIAARRAGIRVLEFGIGFPPRIFKKKIGETIYSINAIPFGGFVKLFGEDATSEEIIKNKQSYAHKSPWVRTKVVIAGVLMNFFLAILLLTIGFSFGIEPLLVTEQDLFFHLGSGNVKTLPGVFVSKVRDNAKTFGIKVGDQILAVNDQPIHDASQVVLFEKGKASKDIDLLIRQTQTNQPVKIHIPFPGKDRYYGIDLKPFTDFPRLSILEVKSRSKSQKAGIAPGDAILQINSQDIYSVGDLQTILAQSERATFTLLRDNQILTIPVTLPDFNRVVLADIFEKSTAERAGFKRGDILVVIDGIKVSTPEDVQELLKKNLGKEMLYRISRGGVEKEIKTKTGEGNFLGVLLSSVASFRNNEFSVYPGSVLTSITEIKKVRYGPWKAFKEAISESIRLTGLTVRAFGRTVRSIVSQFTVPSDIGGPVQIAYYTHTFVQEGFFALLRFTALLSLSLAVINVLPIPALDGGRFLFILIEVIFKKRVNARIESAVHGIGFLLLLGLILFVTYSDITKLF